MLIFFSTAGSDYEAVINQTLIFTSTTTVINVPLTIKDDSITEPTEAFVSLLSLQSRLSNVTIQPGTAQITILDNDAGEMKMICMSMQYTFLGQKCTYLDIEQSDKCIGAN